MPAPGTNSTALYPGRMQRRREPGIRMGTLALRGMIAAGVVALAAATAWTLGHGAGRRLGGHEGACITMDMAMAIGLSDESGRRLLARSLTSALNPYIDRFAGGHHGLANVCADVARKRWSPERLSIFH